MSRGDPHYMKLDMLALTGGKIQQLSVSEFHTYEWGYWRLSVLRRSERIPCVLVTTSVLHMGCMTGVRSVPTHTQRLHNLGLITVWQNGDVTVHGTRARHGKLTWNERPCDCSVEELYRPYTKPIQILYRGIARQHDSTTAREEVTNTLSQDSISNTNSVLRESELVPKGGMIQEPEPIRILTDDQINDEADRILLGFGLDTENPTDRATIWSMFKSYKAVDVVDAFLVTKDKQMIDREGTSEVPLQTSALAYMWGCLRGNLKEDGI